MRPGRHAPNSRLLLALGAASGVIVTAWLGNWQLDRAAEKLALQQRMDLAQHQPALHLPSEPVAADTLLYRRVEARGEFRPELTILLDNRVHEGVVGYEVITPLRLARGDLHVLVNRGWVKAPRTRQELPALVTPAGEVRVEGIALPPSKRYLELSSQTVSGAVWQNLDLERFAAAHQTALQPIVVQQRNDAGDGLLRAWRRPDTGVSTHRAYALQWYVMSALIALAYVVLHVRGRDAPRSAD
jgi:surfeit locus 1 family protein